MYTIGHMDVFQTLKKADEKQYHFSICLKHKVCFIVFLRIVSIFVFDSITAQ